VGGSKEKGPWTLRKNVRVHTCPCGPASAVPLALVHPLPPAHPTDSCVTAG